MPIYSHSQLQTFENCPFKYRLQYIERIKSDVDGIEAFMGNRVHEVLEALYRDVRMGKIRSLTEVLDLYQARWDAAWHDRVNIVKQEYTAEDYRQLGLKSVSDYYERYYPFDQTRTIDLERRIMIKLGGGKYELKGFIDRLALVSDDEFEIHDYKSSSRLPSQDKLDTDRQLALYQMGVEQAWPGAKRVHLIWHYLVFNQEMRSYRGPDQLKALEENIIKSITELETAVAENAFEPVAGSLCDWCEYQELCPKRRHLVTVAGLPEPEYLMDDGVRLVDRYAELEAERQAIKTAAEAQLVPLEAELQKVKEAAAAFAAKIKAEVLAGSAHLLKIKTETKDKYPLKGDAGRPELDEILKTAGIWAEVADLNASTLNKLIKEGKLAADVVENIRQYRDPEIVQSFSLSKLKTSVKATK